MTELLIYAVLALVAPYAIFVWFHNNKTIVYRGQVTISNTGLLPVMRASVTDYDFVTAFLPDGTSQVVEVSKQRLARLQGPASRAYIEVVQPLFGARYVSSIRWAGEEAADKGDTKYVGLFLATSYLLLGMFAAAIVDEPANLALVGHLGYAYVALLFIVSGLVLGIYLMKPVPADAQGRLLYIIPFGKGRASLWMMTLTAAVLTGFSFWFGGVWLLLGLNTAVALGSLVALLAKPAAKSAS